MTCQSARHTLLIDNLRVETETNIGKEKKTEEREGTGQYSISSVNFSIKNVNTYISIYLTGETYSLQILF